MFKEQEEKLQLNPNSTFVEGYEQEIPARVVDTNDAPETVIEDQVDVRTEVPKTEVKEEKKAEREFFGFEPSNEISETDDYESANKWSKTLLDKVA